MEQNNESSIFESGMDTTAQGHLLSVSNWSRFIAIVAFICIGLVGILLASYGQDILDAFSAYTPLGNSAAAGFLAIAAVALLVCILWVYFLFRASMMIRKGLQTKNSNDLAQGFKALKIYFTFSAVLSVLSLLGTLQTMF